MGAPAAAAIVPRIDGHLVKLECDLRAALKPGCNASFMDGYDAAAFLRVITDLIAVLYQRESNTDWRPVNACAPLAYQNYRLTCEDGQFHELALHRRRALLAAMIDMLVGSPRARCAAFRKLHGTCGESGRAAARTRFSKWPEPIRSVAMSGFAIELDATARRRALRPKLRGWRKMLTVDQRGRIGL